MTRDPVCGMEFKDPPTISEVYRGKRFYFCSAVCRNKFTREPPRYARIGPVARLWYAVAGMFRRSEQTGGRCC